MQIEAISIKTSQVETIKEVKKDEEFKIQRKEGLGRKE